MSTAFKKPLLSFLAACTFIWLAGFIWFFMSVARADPSDAARTDAIIVLTGGANRINTGLDLFHEGLAGKMLISGVDSRVSVDKLISLWKGPDGEPLCCITLGHDAKNTRQNALEARSWVEREGISSVRLVTSGYHLPRARLEFRHALKDVKIIPHAVPHRPSNVEAVILAFGEYNKTILTWLRLLFS